jgi:transposase
MLQPVRRRTWAPKGKTPVQYSWDSRDRLSVISAITISPKRRRLGLYFHIHPQNIRSEQAVPFLKAVRRHLGRKFIVVLDRYSVHRKTVRLLERGRPNWFEVEWLPSYAPEINPVEGVWNYSKYSDLANFIPADVQHLRRELRGSLDAQKHKPELILSYFKHAKLEL